MSPGDGKRPEAGRSTRVKVCGVTRPEDARAAAGYGAWAVGLVFHPASPRCVTPDQARRVLSTLPDGVRGVGVFMDQPEEEVMSVQRNLGLHLVQLHGSENDGIIERIGTDRCIKSFTLEDQEDLSLATRCLARYLLLDRPRSAGRPEGPPVDRGLATQLVALKPRTLLAGALGPENVEESIRTVRPWGVDVSSGIETAPGIKDHGKMEAFFAAVRHAETAGDGA